MGYAKYTEDIEEQICENQQRRTCNATWEREVNNINRAINPHQTHCTSNANKNELVLERYDFLQNVSDSLKFRINIAYSALNVKSAVLRSIVLVHCRDMEEALVNISHQLEKCSLVRLSKKMEFNDIDRIEAKKMLILQILNRLLSVINNAESVTSAELEPIIDDMCALITWYKDNSRLNGSLSFNRLSIKEISDFFVTELEYSTGRCSACGQETITSCKFCLACAEKL